jgi:polyisoprenoid-binding protein YceI
MKIIFLSKIEQYPTMDFKSDKLQFEGGKVVSADGQFTLLGVAKPLHLTVNHFACGPNPLNKKPMCAADITATLLVLLASSASGVHAAQTYVFDSVHSTPTFEFKHLGLTTQSGHFDKVRGTLTLDRAARTGSVHFSVEAASLNMGFGTATPASPGFALLKVGNFPTIDYQSEQLFFDDQQRVVATGDSGGGLPADRRQFAVASFPKVHASDSPGRTNTDRRICAACPDAHDAARIAGLDS